MKEIITKKCPKCGERKADSQFDRNKRILDGLDTYCKICRGKYKKEYHAAHPEKDNERSRKWSTTHREQANKYRRERHATNPERTNKHNREYRAANREEANKRRREYLVMHPGKSTEYTHHRRALKMNAEGNGVTAKQWEEIKASYFYLCAYCNQKKPLQMDHIIPLSKGGRHDIDNIAPACEPCNSSKGISSLLEFLYRRPLHE